MQCDRGTKDSSHQGLKSQRAQLAARSTPQFGAPRSLGLPQFGAPPAGFRNRGSDWKPHSLSRSGV